MNQANSKLVAALPLGMLTSRSMMLEQGFAPHSLDNYVKSGRLKLLVKGVYTRPESLLSWQSVATSLPAMMGEAVAVGGLTALELQGFAHYLPMNAQRVVHFYSPAACPGWLKQLFNQIDDAALCWHRTGRLWVTGWPDVPLRSFDWREGDPAMQIATPEQAMLEVLMSLPDEVSFEHAEELMQGLTQLSPKHLGVLLQHCQSVKVKRLFFWLADRFSYPWRQRLHVSDYDLGSGKRVIAVAGKLDVNYNITVPQSYFRDQRDG